MAEDDSVLPGRWYDVRGRMVDDEERRMHLERELVREVAPGHVLYGVAAQAVGACQHCDDVVFALAGGRYAVVHLSYPQTGFDRPPWPDAELYADWEAVVGYLIEHEEL